jgi:hypothetical protein
MLGRGVLRVVVRGLFRMRGLFGVVRCSRWGCHIASMVCCVLGIGL